MTKLRVFTYRALSMLKIRVNGARRSQTEDFVLSED